MTVFLIVAALLTATALLFILPTLLRNETLVPKHALRDEVNLSVLRDQMRELDVDFSEGTIDKSAYEVSKQELERRVAEDVQPAVASAGVPLNKRWMTAVIGLTIPVIAISLYFLIGSPNGLDPTQVQAPTDQAHPVTKDEIAKMVEGLAQRLQTNPDNAEGWNMLARSYNAMGRYSEAADAYAHLVKLSPSNADLLADYADALAMSLNKSLQGEPEKIIARALVIDPKNIKSLALAGSAAFERHDYQAAITQWKKILVLVPPESDTARSVMSNIGEAQNLVGGPATTQAPVATASSAQTAPASAATAATATVEGMVELDAALRSKVADSDSVFIFARAAEGPRFPLAVLRKQVKDLPTNFVLGDNMSMVPNAKISGFPMVVVGARISKSGSATPSAGDLEGVTEPVRPGAKGLKIRINSQRK